MTSKAEFLKKYGAIYEHSSWIAEEAYAKGKIDTVEELHNNMKFVVMNASHDKKLALIRAHPELGSKVKMAEASVQEQAGAGLDHCTAAEFAEFQQLNTAYNKKFGFPFIIAVKGLTREDILKAFSNRLQNGAAAEFETALAQIHKIAWFRLQALG